MITIYTAEDMDHSNPMQPKNLTTLLNSDWALLIKDSKAIILKCRSSTIEIVLKNIAIWLGYIIS